MKLKLPLLFIAIITISAAVFAQQPEIKPQPKPEAKTPEAAAGTPAPAKLPAAKEIIDRYVQAIGGRAANEKFKTRASKGTIELAPMGVKGTIESYAAAPDKIYTKLTLAGLGDIIDAYDGTTAWVVNPLQGNRDKAGAELLQTKLMSTFHRDVNLDKLYPQMEVKGVEKVGDREAYVVVATPVGLDPQTFYFDKENGYLLRSDSVTVSPEGKTPIKSYFDDFRTVDGVKIPFKVRAVTPQFEIVTVLTEIKNDAAVDEKIFSKPAK